MMFDYQLPEVSEHVVYSFIIVFKLFTSSFDSFYEISFRTFSI